MQFIQHKPTHGEYYIFNPVAALFGQRKVINNISLFKKGTTDIVTNIQIKIEYNLDFYVSNVLAEREKKTNQKGLVCAGVWPTKYWVRAWIRKKKCIYEWARRKLKQINTTFGHSLVQRAMKMWLPMGIGRDVANMV